MGRLIQDYTSAAEAGLSCALGDMAEAIYLIRNGRTLKRMASSRIGSRLCISVELDVQHLSG